MTEDVFEEFKPVSQREYALNFASVENVELEEGLKHASEQFARRITNGLHTFGHFFFEAFEKESNESIGYLWLGIQDRMGRKVVSINDIIIKPAWRGKGHGKALIKCVEDEAHRLGARRIRLHVFKRNVAALKLYSSMGFQPTSIDMMKSL